MPVESSKGCNTALKSCCSVLVHSAQIDTEPPIFFDAAMAGPFATTIDRLAMVGNATAAIRAFREACALLNNFILITPLSLVVIFFMRPTPLPPEESEGRDGPPRRRKAGWNCSSCPPGNFRGGPLREKVPLDEALRPRH